MFVSLVPMHIGRKKVPPFSCEGIVENVDKDFEKNLLKIDKQCVAGNKRKQAHWNRMKKDD